MLDPRAHRPHMNSFHSGTWEATTNSDFLPSSKLASSEFRTESKDVVVDVNDDDSGICSPPLWRTSPPRTTHYGSLSPSSRTQAIVRGQRELMEMVRHMPETSYELSLKDLVEHHHRVKQDQKTVVDERELSVYNKSGGGGSRKVGNLNKSGSNIDRGGFYLKMGFPFSLGSNKNKKQNKKKKKKKKDESSLANSSSRVSPRPSASDGSVKGAVDKEWWKKCHSKSKESDSGESSINSESLKSSASSSSNSSATSNTRTEKIGGRCWPFIRRPKSLTLK